MTFIDVPECPYSNKFAPTIEEIHKLCNWFGQHEIDNFLEFGGGQTTWYLYNSLSVKSYVSVETWPASVKNLAKHLPEIRVVPSFQLIPKKKYSHVFVDSTGLKKQNRFPSSRYVTVEYISKNDLVEKGAILIAHDYINGKKRCSLRNNPNTEWHKTMEKYGWEVIDEIKGGMWFGVYQKK